MSNQIPPRERGLQPTHFIDAISNGGAAINHYDNHKYYWSYNGKPADIRLLQLHLNATAETYCMLTIAIFKIYPK